MVNSAPYYKDKYCFVNFCINYIYFIMLTTSYYGCVQKVKSFFVVFFFFGHTSWLARSYFPDQGLNPRPQ